MASTSISTNFNLSLRWKICIIAVIIVLIAVAVIVFLRLRNATFDFVATEKAVAVATTPINVHDGLWDPKRYSDELYYPVGLTFSDGIVVVADSMCDRLVILEPEKSKRVGRPGQFGLAYHDSGAIIDGYRENALFMKPTGVAEDINGDIIIADTGNNMIRRMNDEFVTSIAGGIISGFQDGREGAALFNGPRDVAVDSEGYIYVADTMNHCIRRIDRAGNVTLFAGTPETSGYTDGGAQSAMFFEPSGITVSPDGIIYVADSGNHCIRMISGGVVSTIAGRPGEIDRATGYSQGGYINGDYADALFNAPRGITLMPDGRIIVADTMNHSVRLLDNGTVITLAGNGMPDSMYHSAENLRLTRPEGVLTDGETLYISDTYNNRVLAVPLTERIMAGRPTRDEMLANSGVTLASKYSYDGDIRIYIGDQRVDMGRVQPWNTTEYVYIPVRPLFEALGAAVHIDEKTDVLIITVDGKDTMLELDIDYFIMKGAAVTTMNEMLRLFPYILEWYPEYSLITVHPPADLAVK